MRRISFTVVLFLFTLLAIHISGCGDIGNMIENATERDVNFTKTVHDGVVKKDVAVAPMVQDEVLSNQNEPIVDAFDLTNIVDPIDLSKEHLPGALFYFYGRMINNADQNVEVEIALYNNKTDQLEPVMNVYLAPHQTLNFTHPHDLSDKPRNVHKIIVSKLRTLGKDKDGLYTGGFQLTLYADCPASVQVPYLGLANLPLHRKTESFDSSAYHQYSDYFLGVKESFLNGSVQNDSDFPMTVELYISKDGRIEGDANLVATATLGAKQFIYGKGMMLSDGEAKLADGIKEMIEGTNVFFEYIIIADDAFTATGFNLEIEAAIKVGYDIGW